jgi:DNA-binding response OmpR family regulator
MATELNTPIALYLRSAQDDSSIISEFQRLGITVRPVNQLSEALAFLNTFAHSVSSMLAIAPAQHGGIALLELLTDLNLLQRVKVVLIDPENDPRVAIKALRLGACDYFITGMPDGEIQSRISNLIEKRNASAAGQPPAPATSVETVANSFRMENFTTSHSTSSDAISINGNLRAIRKGDMWVSLSPIEWRLFEELIRNRGRVVNFEELVRRGLNRDRVTPSETSLLRLHMSRLRAKLSAHFDRDLNIITLRGRGYMLA